MILAELFTKSNVFTLHEVKIYRTEVLPGSKNFSIMVDSNNYIIKRKRDIEYTPQLRHRQIIKEGVVKKYYFEYSVIEIVLREALVKVVSRLFCLIFFVGAYVLDGR